MTPARDFRCQPDAVPAARRFVREHLRGHSDAVVEAVELMTSELATNCVRHARTDFELSVDAGPEIRVEVRDTGGGRPVPQSPGARDPSGRGLLIVEAMSDEWGVIDAADGKIVWFSLLDRAIVGTPEGLSAAGAPLQAAVSDAPPGAAAGTAVTASPGGGGGDGQGPDAPVVDARCRLSRTRGRPRPSRRRSPVARRRASARPCTPSA